MFFIKHSESKVYPVNLVYILFIAMKLYKLRIEHILKEPILLNHSYFQSREERFV